MLLLLIGVFLSLMLYDTVNVLVGYTIIDFSCWTGYYGIWIHPSLNCNGRAGAIKIADVVVYGGACLNGTVHVPGRSLEM